MEQQTAAFSSRHAFTALLRQCLARAEQRLQCFDPDFSSWELDSAENQAILRRFLLGKGRIELVAHDSAHLARAARFMRLLRDFGAAIECRVSGAQLRHLSDSFCLADAAHMVRRFHCDHPRGAAVFDDPAGVEPYAGRFAAIWLEAQPGLHAGTIGL